MASAKSSKNSNGAKTTKIGPWVLGSFLGQGYAAQVREATHEKTGQRAAIKILTKDDNNEKADLLKKMREKEITIMKLVDHPNIVRLYDVYETSNHIYLVMELLQGSLFSYVVKSVRVSPNKALVFFQQIIEALDYMHKHLICHRDLKPENFLLNSSSQLKVCDFGFASLMKGDDEMLNTRCGTLHYASPDILTEGDGYDGRLHDVWSAGVNLYVMVTGELPFNDKNPKILLRKIMTGTFEFPPQVPLPYDLKDMIFRMLTVDSKQRISIPEIKRHPWYCSKPYNIPQDVVAHINIEEPFEDIDEQILNAILLLGVGWDNLEEFRGQLKKRGANSEKVVYLLLLRKKLNPSMEAYSYSYVEKIQRTAAGGLQNGDSEDKVSDKPSEKVSEKSEAPPAAVAGSTPVKEPIRAGGSRIGAAPPSTSTNGTHINTPPPPPSTGTASTSPSSPPPSSPPLNRPSSPPPASSSSKDEKKKKRNTKQFEVDPKNKGVVIEQNQTVSSIDKILNWFQKDKKRRDPTPQERAPEGATNEDDDDEEDPFFDLLLRSTATQAPKKGDLRIQKSGSSSDLQASPSVKRFAPQNSSSTTQSSWASSTPSQKLDQPPPEPAQVPPNVAPTPTPTTPPTQNKALVPYVVFVPADQIKEFEERNKGLSLSGCQLISSSTSTSVSSLDELTSLTSSGGNIQCIPNSR